MAEHEVRFTIPERELGKADIEFRIRRDRAVLGRLRISNGSLVWVPALKKYGYRLSWRKFNELAQEHGEEGHE